MQVFDVLLTSPVALPMVSQGTHVLVAALIYDSGSGH